VRTHIDTAHALTVHNARTHNTRAIRCDVKTRAARHARVPLGSTDQCFSATVHRPHFGPTLIECQSRPPCRCRYNLQRTDFPGNDYSYNWSAPTAVRRGPTCERRRIAPAALVPPTCVRPCCHTVHKHHAVDCLRTTSDEPARMQRTGCVAEHGRPGLFGLYANGSTCYLL
jgi:hypothetical protein